MSRAPLIVRFLADLAGGDARPRTTHVDPSTMRWLPLSYTRLLRGERGRRGEPGPLEDGFRADDVSDRIFKTARLHGEEDSLRVGWLWVAGRHPTNGPTCFPLASMSVRTPPLHGVKNAMNWALRAGYRFADVEAVSEPELTDLIEDADLRDRLADVPSGGGLFDGSAEIGIDLTQLASTERGRDVRSELQAWATTAAEAAAMPARTLRSSLDAPPDELVDHRLAIVVGLALYVAPPSPSPRVTTAATLRRWAELGIDDTAFAHLYGDDDADRHDAPAPDGTADDSITSPLLLDPAQRRVVRSASERRLTVVSGPPGTGKSQTVVATALHHVADGQRVLVAAPTDAAVAALVALLESSPGPDPIVFGASARRLDVARRLADGGGPWFGDDEVREAHDAARVATDEHHRRRADVVELLESERAATADPAAVLLARQHAPGLFGTAVDLGALHQLAERAARADGWLGRRRAQRALDRLRSAARCERSTSLTELLRLLDIADTRQRAAVLEAAGGLDLTRTWPQLVEADARMRDAAGRALEAATHHDDRTDRSARRAIAAVATALRSGRAARRQALAAVDGRDLTTALPLWIGTLRDIDDLLPMQPGLFDLVIVDEASHIDQIGAAPALLRARRTMIVGDPRQLRHVSFLADERVRDTLARHGLADLPVAAQLDVRRQTLFDTAAAAAPVNILDEHYRSAPHLIAFSASHFYDGRLRIATRHPRHDGDDRIDVIEVSGRRDDSGVNRTEVATVIDRLRDELREGATSVGVVTPFRAQADALEAAAIEGFRLEEIDALDLRIGTVHSFQGCQRDIVYLSFAIDDDAPRGSRSFMSEASLFNVMITRARQRIHVVSSVREPAGLLADYLRHAEQPLAVLADGDRHDLGRWAARVHRELEQAGCRVRAGYVTGRHRVDIVLGETDDAVAVVCGVHPDGAHAHVERHLDLVRRGWHVVEVFESRWADRLPELVVDLSAPSRR